MADPEALSEVECWQHILRLLHAARKKLGKVPPHKAEQ